MVQNYFNMQYKGSVGGNHVVVCPQLDFCFHNASIIDCLIDKEVLATILRIFVCHNNCYELLLEPVVRVRKEFINQNKAESVTLRYFLYIYLTNPRGLYVTSPNVVLALSSLHYVMQAPLLCILRHINVIEK